jgi:hypothetical protein
MVNGAVVDPTNLVRRELALDGRRVSLELSLYHNGCVLVIYEREPRLGSLTIALRTGTRADSAAILPAKYGGLLPQLVAEAAATLTGGFAAVFLHLKGELSPQAARELLEAVKGLISESLEAEKG